MGTVLVVRGRKLHERKEREKRTPAMLCAKGQALRCISADGEIPLASEERNEWTAKAPKVHI